MKLYVVESVDGKNPMKAENDELKQLISQQQQEIKELTTQAAQNTDNILQKIVQSSEERTSGSYGWAPEYPEGFSGPGQDRPNQLAVVYSDVRHALRQLEGTKEAKEKFVELVGRIDALYAEKARECSELKSKCADLGILKQKYRELIKENKGTRDRCEFQGEQIVQKDEAILTLKKLEQD